jgi:hypothetical protein
MPRMDRLVILVPYVMSAGGFLEYYEGICGFSMNICRNGGSIMVIV